MTYLFDGEIVHRDSLGSHQPIRPGDVNWMTAGRRIVHSERTGPELRRTGSRAHGLQLWVGLPLAHEETEPEFRRHPAATLPSLEVAGARIRVLAGSAFGETSPVNTFSPLFYADVVLQAGRDLPLPNEHEEHAAYVIDGTIACGSECAERGRMIVFAPGAGGAYPKITGRLEVIVGEATAAGRAKISVSVAHVGPARWGASYFPA